MKIYILQKEESGRKDNICVSEDINKIRTSICKDFNPNEDYPILEIWDEEVLISSTTGSNVLKKISSEINESINILKQNKEDNLGCSAYNNEHCNEFHKPCDTCQSQAKLY